MISPLAWFRRWRLSRREHLSFADAAWLFGIDPDDVAVFYRTGYISVLEDMTLTRYPSGELVVERRKLEHLLFTPVLPACPADDPLWPAIPFPPMQLVLRW